MTPLHLRRTLFVAVLCLLAASVSTAQRRAHAGRVARAQGSHVIPSLSPMARASLLNVQAVNVPWFDSLETGAPGWTKDGFWNLAFRPQTKRVLTPTISPTLVILPDSGYLPAAFSGSYAWWYGQDSTGTYIGNDFLQVTQDPLEGGTSVSANSGSVVTPPINLVGQKTPVLTFWTWWEIEGVNTDNYDLMNVEASVDSGVTWTPLGRGLINPISDPEGAHYTPYSSGGLGAKGQWIKVFFDLSPYNGSVVWIRFRFDTVDDLYNGFRGWIVDNISVTAAAVGAPTISSASPGIVTSNAVATTVVSVVGTNFVSGATLRIDTLVEQSAAVLSSTLMQFDVPSTLTAGTHSVSVTNPDGKTGVKANAFSVTADAPPVFYSVTPDSAPAGVATAISVFGSNFLPGVLLDIGGVACTGIQFIGASQINAYTPASLPEGSYTLRITNADGLTAVSILGFSVFAPPLSVVATGDSLIGKIQPLTITPPAGKTFAVMTIYFRAGGTAKYDTLSVSGAGPYAVTLPAKVVTLRGVEYYIRLMSAAGASVTFPAANPSIYPAVFPVRVAKYTVPLPLKPLTYRMISAPMTLDNPRILAQLGDDYGAYNPANWRVFRWELNAYREFGSVSAITEYPMTLDPGKAYWLITAAGAPFSFKSATSVQTVQPYTVPLDTGWNQIADPFAFRVAWGYVQGSSYLSGPYFYDGSQYMIAPVLAPFEGYFVYNPSIYETSALVFQPVEDSVAAVPKTAVGAGAQAGDFVLRLAAEIPGTEYRDTYNYIGLRGPGSVLADAPKPPPIGPSLLLNVLEGGRAYLQKFRSPSGDGQSFIFTLQGPGGPAKATLTVSSSGTLPAGQSVYVFDLVNGNVVPGMPGASEVSLDGGTAPRTFKVVIGTDAFAAKESGGIPLQPVSFALEQNYPNPFNPSTTIRYSLEKKSDVLLEVYNTLGQRVRTLVDAAQATGQYAVTWDGTTDGGAHVASGVYFYRLRTGEFTAVRKLAMIR
ncbi:MAG TPA: T9SS type A sorting domain-containing protein [Bacteroidota bacterium]|nr:T9SS type A sorting domain-containing protein [Bacteroidota bacterium]